MKSNDYAIADRLEDFFNRYHSYLVDTKTTIQQEISLEEPDLENEKIREKKLIEFNSEYVALKTEWDQTEGLSESEINKVGSFASQVSALADEIKEVLDSHSQATQIEMDAIQEELVRLKQGKNAAKQFGPDEKTGAKFMNRKA
jgi:hypothetical protein